jgi:hypothetical protein
VLHVLQTPSCKFGAKQFRREPLQVALSGEHHFTPSCSRHNTWDLLCSNATLSSGNILTSHALWAFWPVLVQASSPLRACISHSSSTMHASSKMHPSSTMHASGVRLVLRHVSRTLYCLPNILPGASPRALLQGGSYSSGLVTCRCLALARHGGSSRFVSAGPCPIRPFSSKRKGHACSFTSAWPPNCGNMPRR